MNDWYIDRSKNFINSTLDSVIRALYNYSGPRDSASLISYFENNDIFDDSAGNSNAALTRFRDHGLIDNDNNLSDASIDYYDGLLSKEELIIDLFIKRPALKKNSPDVKPLVILCKVFDYMFDLLADTNEVYLSYEECYKYLYPCNSLDEITLDFVDEIISGREVGQAHVTLKQNEITNLSIWFNALKCTPLFLPEERRTIIKPNVYALTLMKFVANNGIRMSTTPTRSNSELYNYYCDREKGFSEIIPYKFKPNIVINDNQKAIDVFNYIFGIRRSPGLDYKEYFTEDCFGIYNPLLFIPGIVLKKIYYQNLPLGKELYSILKQWPR